MTMTADWFVELCAGHGLVPAAPVSAKRITEEHVLFTVTGDPLPVKSVRVGQRRVTVHYTTGGEPDRFHPDRLISLIARRAA